MNPIRSLAGLVIAGLLLTGAHAYAQQNWPMYGRNLRHTFSNSASLINSDNVASLKQVWAFQTGDAVSASPTIVNGVLYVGSWDGFFYAIDTRSGALIWKFQVDCDNTVVPIPPQCLAPGQSPPPRFFTQGGLITSTAAVAHGNVYFAAGKTMYSVDAKDGSLRWKQVICGNPEQPACATDAADPTQIFSSPAVFGGMIFIGHTAGADRYRGAIEALDAKDGSQRWRFEVDPILDAEGRPILNAQGRAIGGYNRGCGTVWSSAAVDAELRLVFFGTGDCNNGPAPPYHESIVALDADTGLPAWVYTPPDLIAGCDQDFGASPNLLSFGGRRYLGEGGKDGTYYLLTRAKGELVWSRNVVFGGSAGGFFGASFDRGQIFAATSLGDGNIATQDPTTLCAPSNPADTFLQEPSMHAFAVSDGGIVWQQTQNHSVAPTSVANGVVFSGLIGIEGFGLNAYDARSGKLLVRLPMSGSVNSAATPLEDYLFVTAGTSTDGSGSGVFAFALPASEAGSEVAAQ
ncbi:MAG: PQQ-binding-like beta-propeller repeat protein [Acetobacteraceae bacterium]|nr:PQQ-binding-like beta-propeller repeat protein [Acetobacteraceae bacterium]